MEREHGRRGGERLLCGLAFAAMCDHALLAAK